MTRRQFSDIEAASAIGSHVSKSLKGMKLPKPKAKKQKRAKKEPTKRPSVKAEKTGKVTSGPGATHAVNPDTGKAVKLSKVEQAAVASFYNRPAKAPVSGGLSKPKPVGPIPVKKPRAK